MRQTRHQTLCAIPLSVVGACLFCASLASAEECTSPCTITHSIVPQLQLNDSSSGATGWIVSSSNNGAEFQIGPSGASLVLRIEDGAPASLLVLDSLGRAGIGTTAPQEDLQVSSSAPGIRLDDTSAGEGLADLEVNGATFSVNGNDGQNIVQVDTRAPTGSLRIREDGRVGLGTTTPEAKLHVIGDARIEGNVALGSSRTLKTAFSPVSSSEILAKVDCGNVDSDTGSACGTNNSCAVHLSISSSQSLATFCDDGPGWDAQVFCLRDID